MTKEEFEKLIQKAIESFPLKIKKLLDNVVVVVEDLPDDEITKKLNLPNKYALFGLYQGIPKTKRGVRYGNVLPDKITLFQKPIEKIAQEPKKIEEIVKKTLWHEIAHHFGFDEREVRKLEKKKFQNNV